LAFVGSIHIITPRRTDARDSDVIPFSPLDSARRKFAISTNQTVAVLVGSLRERSLNRRAANALARLAPAGMELSIVEIGQLPLYSEDLDNSPPRPWASFREQIKTADAVLFVTPEYNRSVPGVLKNAIDVGSRPYGQSVWNGKPGAVMSVAPGAIGGFGANHHLRQSMVFLNVPMMQQPEAYVGGAANLFDDAGAVTNESTRKFFEDFIAAFSAWISVVLAK
jgi:chromate reductase